MSDFKSHIGDDTEVVIEYDYEPGQKEIIHPVDDSQPGYDATIEINFVMLGEDDILGDLCTNTINRFEQEIMDSFED